MGRLRAVLLALLTGWCGGCVGGQTQRCATLFDARRPFSGPTGSDVVQIDLAVVQRPLGDRYINQDLWDPADEQGVSLEHKAVLEENGFRVCQVSGLPPAGLQALLTSERSCPDPRRISLHAGSPAPVALGPVWKQCRFRLKQGDQATAVDLADAQCVLEVVPTLSEDGRTLLRFTPHVKHGQARRAPHPSKDAEGALRWEWDEKQPDEVYPWLAWELTVAPSEYVVVGTRLDREGTLGQRCFLGPEGAAPVQRLLVIRTTPCPDAGGGEKPVTRVPPLALQASWTCARGSCP
jgi:hypothetical protein